jgi:glycogen debranching enzyme
MDMNCNLLSPFHSSELWKQQFRVKSEKFMKTTEEHVLQGINPGGIYSAIWCRDAAYILRDWFLLGKIDEVLQQISFIWSHQILPGKEKIIYGRGSPEMEFLSVVARDDIEKTFEGALPTSIYRAGFSEVYAANPDIDSTALMISTTSWILYTVLKAGICKFISLPPTSSSEKNNATSFSIYPSTRSPNQVIEYVVPLMLKAIDYLSSRDIDNDGLLEQNHNEDWMDTVLRAGKIVYSQSCWILALTNLSLLLLELNQQNKGLSKIRNLLDKAIKAVEDKLWSEQDNSYVDLQESHHVGGPFRTLTQDVSLYLVAITENINYEISGSNYNIQKGQICQQQQQHQYQFILLISSEP